MNISLNVYQNLITGENVVCIYVRVLSVTYFSYMISSYLDRVQVVRYDGTVSNTCRFRYGIPQGSCLGPTLFIFYLNELFKYISDVNVLMFADNKKAVRTGTIYMYYRETWIHISSGERITI